MSSIENNNDRYINYVYMLLKKMKERQASDLFITVNFPPALKKMVLLP